MKNLFVSSIFLAFTKAVSQVPEIKADLPTVLLPSPTVSALMKFEEIAVSNYTGVPDIAIPLFSTPTRSSDIRLDISLQYNCLGAGYDAVSSDVGLGWSLLAGGTISRTVKGLPDEYYKVGDITNQEGIYSTEVQIHQNNYYNVLAGILDGAFIDNYTLEPVPDQMLSEWLWETNEKGKYDSEHDLWQFNFMGHTGRFYIQKNLTNNTLEVISLDGDNSLKIVNHYEPSTSDHPYRPTSFDIYDTKGYKYVFDIVETSFSTTHCSMMRINGDAYESPLSPEIIYNSAFHLSKVANPEGDDILTLTYSDKPVREIVQSRTSTISDYMGDKNVIVNLLGDHVCPQEITRIEPNTAITTSQQTNRARKLEKIEVPGFAKILFQYDKGRYDSNLIAADSAYVFKGLKILTPSNDSIRKVSLTQSYSTVTQDRMILSKVSFGNFKNNVTQDYNLSYYTNDSRGRYIGKDYWGYFNLIPYYYAGSGYHDVTPSFITSDVLQKISLPTGGCQIFDFEPNQYSYIGSTGLGPEEYDANPDNWDEQSFSTIDHSIPSTASDLFEIFEDQTATFVPDADMPTSVSSWQYNLEKMDSVGVWHPFSNANISDLACGENQEGCFLPVALTAGKYRWKLVSMTNGSIPYFTAKLTVFYKTRKETQLQYLYGGGIRISKIGYFDTDVPANYYQSSYINPRPAKETGYKYNFFGDPNTSSGALAYVKPNYSYVINKKPCFECPGIVENLVYHYQVNTDFSNSALLKTKGSDVGYKNVTKYETDNGEVQQTYLTPIDYVYGTGLFGQGPPFLPDPNYDYKYGHLIREDVIDKNGHRLKRKDIVYESVNDSLYITGLRTRYIGITSCPISYKYMNYAQYFDMLDHCVENPDATHAVPCDHFEAFKFGGWQTCGDAFTNVECCTDDNGNVGDCGAEVQGNPNAHYTHPYYNPICTAFCYCGRPIDFIGYVNVLEPVGWMREKNIITQEYFYQGSTANTTSTSETFEYDPTNKQVSQHTTTNSLGEVLKTKYFYHNGNSDDPAISQNRISQIERIEQYRDNTLLSTKNIVYDNSHGVHHPWLVGAIQSSKEGQALEDRVIIADYDQYGHPLLAEQRDGNKIYYIWGYNDSEPIARIESPASVTLSSSTVNQLKDMSDVGDSDGLLSKFAELRTIYPNAMVTGYTYIPLIGTEKIVDPKGMVTSYEYDDFGRLKAVYDNQGKLLSTNEYNYRP